MREFKKGKLNIGGSKKKVKNRKQAIAIALSEAGISEKRWTSKKNEKEKVMAGKGLYANIHAKRKRGGKMRKKGAKGAPKSSDFARAKQTARKR